MYDLQHNAANRICPNSDLLLCSEARQDPELQSHTRPHGQPLLPHVPGCSLLPCISCIQPAATKTAEQEKAE